MECCVLKLCRSREVIHPLYQEWEEEEEEEREGREEDEVGDTEDVSGHLFPRNIEPHLQWLFSVCR